MKPNKRAIHRALAISIQSSLLLSCAGCEYLDATIRDVLNPEPSTQEAPAETDTPEEIIPPVSTDTPTDARGLPVFDSTVVGPLDDGIYTGVYTIDPMADRPFFLETKLQTIKRLEGIVFGESEPGFGMDRQFFSWNNLLQENGELNGYPARTSAAGRIPVLSLNTVINREGKKSPVPCPDGSDRLIWPCMAAGLADERLRQMARAIRDSGIPRLMFSLVHEPENEIRCNVRDFCAPAPDTFDMGDSEDYRGAWIQLVQVFRDEGVMNTDFMWILQAASFDPDIRENRMFETPESMYPGNEWIDWLGADAYNTAFSGWRPMSEIVAPFVAWAARHATTKPLALAEFGSIEDPDGRDENRRGDWFIEARDWLGTQPRMKALIYFNRSETINSDFVDWRIDSVAGTEQRPLFEFRQRALVPSLAGFSTLMRDATTLHRGLDSASPR